MFKVFSNAWKIADLRKKILYTLFMLLIYRIGCYIPIPGVNINDISTMVGEYSILGFMDMLSGGAMSNWTIFALGILPYINASIIMNLLTVALPPLERLAKQGDEGRKKIASITRYVGVGLGLIMAIGILISMINQGVIKADWFTCVTIVLCMTAGTALIMWMGERINEKGIGNGISLIIFASIISRVPTTVITMFQNVFAGNIAVWAFVLVVIGVLVIITGITFVDMGERRVNVQYAKRVVGRKMYGGQSTFIPIKVNQSGVMPLIFAVTLINFPGIISEFWKGSAFNLWYDQWIGHWTYIIVYMLLILFFTYFYSQIAFNAVDVSKNMQQNSGFIPGIRPGKPTSDYLQRIVNKVTLFGAIFLAVVAAIPMLFSSITSMNSIFGATSLLIIVNVALETSKQIESQIMMRHYKGFLK